MEKLPIFIVFGGINSAGQTSVQKMRNQLIIGHLKSEQAKQASLDLALVGTLSLSKEGNDIDRKGKTKGPSQIFSPFSQTIRAGILIRRIERSHLDVEWVSFTRPLPINPPSASLLKLLVLKENPPEWPNSGMERQLVR